MCLDLGTYERSVQRVLAPSCEFTRGVGILFLCHGEYRTDTVPFLMCLVLNFAVDSMFPFSSAFLT